MAIQSSLISVRSDTKSSITSIVGEFKSAAIYLLRKDRQGKHFGALEVPASKDKALVKKLKEKGIEVLGHMRCADLDKVPPAVTRHKPA